MTRMRRNLRLLWGVLGGMPLLLVGAAAPAAQVCALGTMAVVEAQRGGCHALSAVVLDQRKKPVVAGTVCLKKSAALHQLTRHRDYIVAQLWNHIEIYSFAEPRVPKLVRSLILDETHPSWGGGGIVHEGERLLILGTTVSAEVTMAGPPADWRVRNLEPTTELKRRTEGLYTQESREKDPADFSLPRRGAVPLEGGVFEVFWRERRLHPGAIQHTQHLKVVESGATLQIDTRLETID
jgi:hypothetical protein